uniref:ANF_receptor domain-containing protein n=1 Tax=Mesocestoides corti TaxID=53468 RepID=A0A5K3FBK4_MESCO
MCDNAATRLLEVIQDASVQVSQISYYNGWCITLYEPQLIRYRFRVVVKLVSWTIGNSYFTDPNVLRVASRFWCSRSCVIF